MDMYAHAIKLQAANDSAGSVILYESTLYPALERLGLLKWISKISTTPLCHDGRIHHFYHLEPAGVAALKQELWRIRTLVATSERRLITYAYGTRERW